MRIRGWTWVAAFLAGLAASCASGSAPKAYQPPALACPAYAPELQRKTSHGHIAGGVDLVGKKGFSPRAVIAEIHEWEVVAARHLSTATTMGYSGRTPCYDRFCNYFRLPAWNLDKEYKDELDTLRVVAERFAQDPASQPYVDWVKGSRGRLQACIAEYQVAWAAENASDILALLNTDLGPGQVEQMRRDLGLDRARQRPEVASLQAAFDEKQASAKIQSAENDVRNGIERERQAALKVQREAEARQAIVDKRNRLSREKPLASGPSAADVISAIRAEYFIMGYSPAGEFGFRVSAGPLLADLTLTAREFDVAGLSCKAVGGGKTECGYMLTMQSTTAQHDATGGLMAGLEQYGAGWLSAFGQGNVLNSTTKHTATFEQQGGQWRSPTILAALKEEARLRAEAAARCRTTTTTTYSDITQGGNILGFMPHERTVTTC